MPKRLREENESASESSKRRKFQCPRCPSVLYSKGHLKIHMRYHTGERPYKCDFCDNCFAERSTLRKHEATHRDPDFWCPFCRKGFCREDSLRVHVRYHNDINPYICTTCNETFRTSSHLREHQRIHTGEKPYQCNLCLQDFRHSYTLKCHKAALHTKKGEQKRRKEEHKIEQVLKRGEFDFDREISIKYDCFEDNDKNHARIDFVVNSPTRNCRFLLEVDENQHKAYPIQCELSRMCQVNEAIRLGVQDERLVWVRYNPNSFRVQGTLKKVSDKVRHEALVEFLKNYEPVQNIEVCYMYYDMDHRGDIVVAADPDFSPTFNEFVTQCMT